VLIVGRCFTVKDDLLVKTISAVLSTNQFRTAKIATDQFCSTYTHEDFVARDYFQIHFDQAEFNVLVVPAVKDVRWELPECNVVQ
jgi:hypothetical protein